MNNRQRFIESYALHIDIDQRAYPETYQKPLMDPRAIATRVAEAVPQGAVFISVMIRKTLVGLGLAPTYAALQSYIQEVAID